MADKSFAKRIRKTMEEQAPRELTGVKIGDIDYFHIYKNKKYNFIDEKYPEKCDVKGNYFGETKKIDYHKGASHLNSSQTMCINFFNKFFEKDDWNDILLKTLEAVKVPVSGKKIKYAIFEYVPDEKERTNFDFYMVLDNNVCVSFEVKYTEADFGGISEDKRYPDRYKRKWTNVYEEKVRECPYLNCDEKGFYEEYQINRNICFAKEGDIVLFLTPRANDAKGILKGRKYIDSYTNGNSNIMNIYWEDVVNALMELSANEPELMDYYGKFKKKYIDIL